MTHGGGSIGHGGGGHHGGGGFHHHNHHHHINTTYRRHHRRDDQPCNEPDGGPIVLIGTLIGFLLCLTKMKRRTRLALVWVWMLSIFLTTGLVLGVKWYKPQAKPASPTDMRIVGGLSTVFCDGVTITSDDGITSFLLDAPPAISSNTTQYVSSPQTTMIKPDKYEYWGFYLLAGSSITIHSCFHSSNYINLYMYVIKGSENFESWRSDIDCSDCTVDYKIYYKACDKYGFHGYNYTLNIKDTDDYYFAYANTGWSPVDLTATFDMNRTTYSLTDYEKTCENTTDCTFQLSLGSSETAVFYVPETDSYDMSVHTKCEARVWVYILIFCIIPLSLGSLCCLLILKVCDESGKIRRPTNNRSASSKPDERTPIIGKSNQPPPSYEEAIQRLP